MDAYYYSFTTTGVQVVDELLSAVASAGKYAHDTSDWTAEFDTNNGYYQPSNVGASPVAWVQNAANRAADAVRALEARAEAGVTLLDEWQIVGATGAIHEHDIFSEKEAHEAKGYHDATWPDSAPHRVVRVAMVDTAAITAETRQPVAWWIGPHDGLLAGATVNKNLADARIEHGATVRPLVFGDVAPSAEAGVTEAEEMVERIARALHEESENPIQGDARIWWHDASPHWHDKMRRMARAALTVALTGGAAGGSDMKWRECKEHRRCTWHTGPERNYYTACKGGKVYTVGTQKDTRPQDSTPKGEWDKDTRGAVVIPL
jgi:hypothetical protein